MKDIAGKLNANLVWLFAVGTIGILFALSYVKLGNRYVGWGLTFAIFAAGAYFGTFLTGSKVGMSILAFAVAALVVTGLAYWRASAALGVATTVAGGVGGSKLASGVQSVGTMVILVPLLISLAISLVGGVVGALGGGKMRAKAQAA